jgi:hypothetical protein
VIARRCSNIKRHSRVSWACPMTVSDRDQDH